MNLPADLRINFLQRFGQALPWVVLIVSLLVTHQLWKSAQRNAKQNLQTVFDSRVREITGDMEERMKIYRQVLRGVRGLFAVSGNVTRDEFRTYINMLRLEENYPGIQGVGYSLIVPPELKDRHTATVRKESLREGFPEYSIHPAGERDIYTSVVYLEPFFGRNLFAFGHDMYSDPVQRVAMERARDSGRSIVSGKVSLLMETDQNIQAGFLMYLPVYKIGMPHDTLAERRASIIGWVYAPFRANDLFDGLLGEYSTDLDFEIYDGYRDRRTEWPQNDFPVLPILHA